MRDETFELFISEFDEATHSVVVPVAAIDRWRGKLPDRLLTYWQEEGWCGFRNGLFWVVNPDDYEDVVHEWLSGTSLEAVDSFHVIARTAFGSLYLWGEKIGRAVTISAASHAIVVLGKELIEKDRDNLTIDLETFFEMKEPDDCDLNDELGEPLFERALQKLGSLNAGEMYGFEPALVAGGKMRLENLVKVNLDVHLTILRQLAPPQMPFSNIDIDLTG